MNNSKEEYKQLVVNLDNANSEQKVTLIRNLRKKTAFSGVILLLAEILDSEDVISVREEIEKFLNDMKDQNFIYEVIESIEKTNNDITKQKLIASCWQSGLDYSLYLENFISYSISLSYLAVIECYSVIEEWIHKADEEDKLKWKNTLNSSLPGLSDEKQKLVEAIKSLL